MKSLLIIAHGSRRHASNDEVRELTRRIASKTDQQFDSVQCAFLELAEPSIPDGIHECVAQGAKEIVILPYFLSAGRHVAEDIPKEVAQTQPLHPTVNIHIAPYLGSLEAIADLMAAQASLIDMPDIKHPSQVPHVDHNLVQ